MSSPILIFMSEKAVVYPKSKESKIYKKQRLLILNSLCIRATQIYLMGRTSTSAAPITTRCK